MRKFLMIMVLGIAVSACTQEKKTFKTASGVEVTRHIAGKGRSPIADSVVLIGLKVSADSNIISESSTERPIAFAFDPEMKAGHLQEVLGMLKVGDSVTFLTTAQNLFVETYKSSVPSTMNDSTEIQVSMQLYDLLSEDAYRAREQDKRMKAQAEEQAELAEKLESDGAEIDKYLEENGIEAQVSESGLRYTVEGGKGTKAQPGDNVKVHYDGRLLSGEKFDSSRDRGEPFEFTIGQGMVIPGWDEGIAYIPQGGKGTLYVPSPLGYGARGAGPVIEPYSILVFDVEVMEVEKGNEDQQ